MKIKYLVMDVDGTLTDGKVYMGNNGEVMKAFNVKDGYGIHDMLMPVGIEPIVLTGRTSEIVTNRCFELGIMHFHQGVSNKLDKLFSITHDLSEVAYVGDDLNDYECMECVKKSGGVVGCPRNASPNVIRIADFVALHDGGDGAVRDFIEWLLNKQIDIGE